MIKFNCAPGAIHALRDGERWVFVVTGCTCGRPHDDKLQEAESCATAVRQQTRPGGLEVRLN